METVRVLKRRTEAAIGYIAENIDRLRHPAYCSLTKDAEDLYRIWRNDCPCEQPEFVHSRWLDVQPCFARLVENGMPYSFLHDPTLSRKFYRIGFGRPQEHELEYLLDGVSENTRDLVRQYRESPVGKPTMDCPQLGISVNSLGMLYYFARIIEQLNRHDFGSIIEFGGGYGSLCRVFLELLPKPPTYVIIDLPEILALQYVFLRGSSSEYRVFPHTSLPIELKEGSLNLVPVHLIEELPLGGDLFVSTFALSEAGKAMQEIITRCSFLNCKAAYMVGQNARSIETEGVHSWESPETIHSAAQRVFDTVELAPFHLADAWELMAWRETNNS